MQSHGITLSFHSRPEGWGGWAPQRRAALLADGHIAYALGDVSGGDLDVVTSIWTTGWTWEAVATGDFNHDGTKDIVWRHWRDGRMAWRPLVGSAACSARQEPRDGMWSLAAISTATALPT